jgi:hypothetical protein
VASPLLMPYYIIDGPRREMGGDELGREYCGALEGGHKENWPYLYPIRQMGGGVGSCRVAEHHVRSLPACEDGGPAICEGHRSVVRYPCEVPMGTIMGACVSTCV